MDKLGKVLSDKEEIRAFYYFIGLTITQWAEIEQSLYWVASANFPKKAVPQFSTAFFSIENFRSKLLAADRLVRQRPANRLHLERWTKLSEEAGKLATKRNALAHFPVRHFPHAKPGRRLVLMPRFSEPSKFKQRVPKPPSDAIGLSDIIDIRHRFFALSLDLDLIYCKLARQKAPLPIAHSSPIPVLNLEQLTRLVRRSLYPPPEPFDD